MKVGEAVVPTLKFAVLAIDQKEYRLAFTYSAIAHAETAAGCRLLSGLDVSRLSAYQLRGLLYAALTPFDPGITIPSAGRLIRFDTAARVRSAVCAAFRLSMERTEKPETRSGGKKKKLTNQERWDDSWSIARVHLGLSDVEFMGMIPRQFYLLVGHYRENVEHCELLSGQIAACVVNWSANRPRRAVKAADFMPSRVGRRIKAPRINRNRIADKIRRFITANPNG